MLRTNLTPNTLRPFLSHALHPTPYVLCLMSAALCPMQSARPAMVRTRSGLQPHHHPSQLSVQPSPAEAHTVAVVPHIGRAELPAAAMTPEMHVLVAANGAYTSVKWSPLVNAVHDGLVRHTIHILSCTPCCEIWLPSYALS